MTRRIVHVPPSFLKIPGVDEISKNRKNLLCIFLRFINFANECAFTFQKLVKKTRKCQKVKKSEKKIFSRFFHDFFTIFSRFFHEFSRIFTNFRECKQTVRLYKRPL